MINLLTAGAAEFGLTITLNQMAQFTWYKDTLLSWNEHINLTGITDEDEIALKHFIDSLSVYQTLKAFAGFSVDGRINIVDVGAGAGFPGLPLKIVWPELNLTLIDATLKKVRFLKEAADQLELSDVACIHGRAEELGHDKAYREHFDAALSRAVAKLDVLAEYCLPLVRKGGLFIALKGPDGKSEAATAGNIITRLGGEIKEIKEFSLPLSDIRRSLIIISKCGQTPVSYPRKQKKISN